MRQWILCGSVILICAPANARVRLELDVVTHGSQASVTLHVTNDNGIRPDMGGFDIARSEYGPIPQSFACNRFTVINEQTLPRRFPEREYSFELVDTGLSEGNSYFYQVILKSNRYSSEEFDIESAMTIVTLGRALIVESAVIVAPDFLLPCANSCQPFTFRIGEAPAAIIGNGKSYRLLGHVRSRPDSERFEWVVEEAIPAECVPYAVVPFTWGQAKMLFRSTVP